VYFFSLAVWRKALFLFFFGARFFLSNV
jgi:hypothetical protein